MQSGPVLVLRGRIHPAFDPRSENRRRRGGVGVRADGRVVFAVSEEPVTFHAFATLFREQLGCPDALYLDGQICAVAAPPLGREDAGDFAAILAVTDHTH